MTTNPPENLITEGSYTHASLISQSTMDEMAHLVEVIFDLGGPVTLILLALSVIALTIILFKSIEIFQERIRQADKINRSIKLWRSGDSTAAINQLVGSKKGIAGILYLTMNGRVKTPAAEDSLLREEVHRLCVAHLQKLRKHLRFLENIGTVSPLLGLFGTVLGMIEAFRQMEAAGNQVDPATLSGGIWQALLTTGVGLAVAIPTVLVHQWLDRQVDEHQHSLEDKVTQVFTFTVGPPDLERVGLS